MADTRRPLVPLPSSPAIRLHVERELLPPPGSVESVVGFLQLKRYEMTAHDPEGGVSPVFTYDLVTRRALDAVIIAAHYAAEGQRYVYLRSCLRPPLALRAIPPAHDGSLWELPAGLIEPGESATDAAVREIAEELGFVVPPDAVAPLGPWQFPMPALIAEHHIFVHVRVDPASRGVPTEDGSPLEAGALIAAVPIEQALAMCRDGTLRDEKTELGLRRLAELP